MGRVFVLVLDPLRLGTNNIILSIFTLIIITNDV